MQNKSSIVDPLVAFFVLLNAIVLATAYTRGDWWYWLLTVTLPLLVIAARLALQERKARRGVRTKDVKETKRTHHENEKS